MIEGASSGDPSLNEFKNGSMIALVGLPSSGKSSTAKALSRQMGVECYLEPEEALWPELIARRAEVGHFTALSWFRSARVPNLYSAAELRRAGRSAIVDSYYDVIVADYIGDPAFEWLISREDPYYPAAQLMVQLDWQHLPKADLVVFLKMDETTWHEFMARRDRDFDRSADLTHYFLMQDRMLSACYRAVQEHGGKLIVLDQVSSTPDDTASRVLASLALA